MKTRLFITAVMFLTAACIGFQTARADFKFEYQGATANSDNMLYNTDASQDWRFTNKALVTYHPIPTVKLEFSGTYTYYDSITDLSNFAGNIALSYIPLLDSNRYAVYINGSFAPTVYKSGFDTYDNNAFNINLGASYFYSKTLQFRVGFEWLKTDYKNEPDSNIIIQPGLPPTFGFSGDHTKYGVYAGGNLSFWGTSLDLEFGYSNISLTFANMPEDSSFAGPETGYIKFLNPFRDTLYDGNAGALFISPRLSRSITPRLGLSATYLFRDFTANENKVIPGAGNSLLSPYASIYDGHAVLVNAKTFYIPNFILSLGFGYFDKGFLTSQYNVELPNGTTRDMILDREDEMAKVYVALKRPFPFKSGLYIEPTVQLEYTDNNSNVDFYTYTVTAVTGGVTIRF